MQSFVIEGGRTLSGTVRAAGNKNGALPILAATVLASDEVRLSNVPRIRDVGDDGRAASTTLGAEAEWTGPNEVRVDPSGVGKTDLDPDPLRERSARPSCSQVRCSRASDGSRCRLPEET